MYCGVARPPHFSMEEGSALTHYVIKLHVKVSNDIIVTVRSDGSIVFSIIAVFSAANTIIEALGGRTAQL